MFDPRQGTKIPQARRPGQMWLWLSGGLCCHWKGKAGSAEVATGTTGGTERPCEPDSVTGKYAPGCPGRAVVEALPLRENQLGWALPSPFGVRPLIPGSEP